jgi:hypothetical protein
MVIFSRDDIEAAKQRHNGARGFRPVAPSRLHAKMYNRDRGGRQRFSRESV